MIVLSIKGDFDLAWKMAHSLYPNSSFPEWTVAEALAAVSDYDDLGNIKFDKNPKSGEVLAINGESYSAKIVDWGTMLMGGQPTLIVTPLINRNLKTLEDPKKLVSHPLE